MLDNYVPTGDGPWDNEDRETRTYKLERESEYKRDDYE